MMKLGIIANWMQGTALSGGDRIFIELSKRWHSKFNIVLFISTDGWNIGKREGLAGIHYNIWSSEFFNRFGYFPSYFCRTLVGIVCSLQPEAHNCDLVYSSSDFWPDSIPAYFMKLRNRHLKWIAGFYLFAPKPWQKDSPYKGMKRILGLIYWLSQLPTYWLIRRWADMVFVTSEPDVQKFVTKRRDRNKILVIQGGVDTRPSKAYLNSENTIPPGKRKYDACFVGRLHYQKGVLELVNIWERVCRKKKNARLALVGIGPLENELKESIKNMKLQDNIDLLGFKDGEDKYEIIKQSRIVVHPATYDSGGMAAAEAIAWGLPGVAFDLEALTTYYPKGMLKTRCFDLDEFVSNIIELLDNNVLYHRLSKDAVALIQEEWDWGQRSEKIYNSMLRIAQEK